MVIECRIDELGAIIEKAKLSRDVLTQQAVQLIEEIYIQDGFGKAVIKGSQEENILLPSAIRVMALYRRGVKGVNIVFSPKTKKEGRFLTRRLAREVENLKESLIPEQSKEPFCEIVRASKRRVLGALEFYKNSGSVCTLYPEAYLKTILVGPLAYMEKPEVLAAEISAQAALMFLKKVPFNFDRVILRKVGA